MFLSIDKQRMAKRERERIKESTSCWNRRAVEIQGHRNELLHRDIRMIFDAIISYMVG